MSRRTYDDGTLIEEWDDLTRTYRRWEGGALVEERPYTGSEIEWTHDATRRTNRDALLSKATDAIQADLQYLALSSPTAGQVAAQVERLTRQTVALLRIVAGHLDSTSGT